MPVLWILVNHGRIPKDVSHEALYVQCSVGPDKAVTEPSSESPPTWSTEMCFENAQQSDQVVVELKRKGFLWDAVVATVSLPLKFVPFATQHNEGEWCALSEKGGTTATNKFSIFLNLRFDFPDDLSESERACLESKLPVLEEEVEVLGVQEAKIKEGVLAVPTPVPTPVATPVHSPAVSSYDLQETVDGVNQTASIDDHPRTPVSETSSALPTDPSVTDGSISEHTDSFNEELDVLPPLESPENRFSDQRPPQHRRRFSTSGSSAPVVKVKDSGTTGDCDTIGNMLNSTSVVGKIDMKIYNTINQEHVVRPARSETIRKSMKRPLGLNKRRPLAPSHHGIDDDLVHTAYRKALQALIYPTLTEEDQHSFEVWSAHKPIFCVECNSLLWGIARQGYKCRRCGVKCHERCATLVNADCSINAARRQEIKRTGGDPLDDKFKRSHVIERMDRQINTDHTMQLELLSECFGVQDAEHKVMLQKAKDEVLAFMMNFKAVIKVRVISAERLNIREEDNNSVYVSVSVGGQRKYTRPFKEKRVPVWHEEFTFECDNAMDRIKVRVWNEASDRAIAKISQKFTKESDHFLGEKIIEVRNLGESTDLWHKLDKRTSQSVVSGSIRLAIAIKVERDKLLTPYHELYSYVHLKLFNHAHLTQALPLVKADVAHGEVPFDMLLPPAFQQIANEFAQRYSIDPLTMAIAHFKCLSQRYVLPQALDIMCILLREIKEEVMDKDEQSQLLQLHHSGEEFRYRGRKHGRLSNILQQLLNSLRIDLQSYREMFPADDIDKLEELSFAIKLVFLIVECQSEALGEIEENPSKIVEDSMRQCSKATFDSLMQEWLAATAEKYPAGSDKTASPLEFFLGLMQLLVAAILEDRNCYEHRVNKYCNFSLEELTAQELWTILGERLCEMLQKQREDDTFPVAEYINLLLALNQMYKDYILPKGYPVPSDVEFPSWFDFYILKYLDSFEEDSLGVTTKAVVSDRNGKFAKLEGKPLSSSVYDIFWWLHEGNKVFDKLSCGNMAVHHIYYKRFAEVISSVIRRYIALIGECMDEFLMDLPLVTMLLNDVQQSRVNLQNIYEAMGGRMRAGDGCSEILTDMQGVLSAELTMQCSKVAGSLYPAILQGVKTIKSEIMRVKGVAKTPVTSKDVTPIVSQLMNTLASKGSEMKDVCEESVLKKLVKELWLVTTNTFHEVLLPGPEETHSSGLEHNFSQRQCQYLEHVLNIVKDFFLSLKEVHLKTKVLEQSLAPIRSMLSMYQQSTNSLICQFIGQETEQDAGQGDDMCGELNLQVESYIHPGSQELELTIQVTSLNGIKPLSPGGTVQKPFVELYLLGPHIHGITRRYRTAPAKGQENFVFANEVKKMTIPQSISFDSYELQIVVKTQGFFGSSGHVLGVTLLQLRNHIGQSCALQLTLVSKLKISRCGSTILSVLAQRSGDELAKEFVSVKREERIEKKGASKTESSDQQ